MELEEEQKAMILETYGEIKYLAKHRLEQITGKTKCIISHVQDGIARLDYSTAFKDLTEVPLEVPYVVVEKEMYGHTVSTVHTLGQYYKDLSWDPSVSEAFDTGFYTAIRMIQEGLIDGSAKDGNGL